MTLVPDWSTDFEEWVPPPPGAPCRDVLAELWEMEDPNHVVRVPEEERFRVFGPGFRATCRRYKWSWAPVARLLRGAQWAPKVEMPSGLPILTPKLARLLLQVVTDAARTGRGALGDVR